MSEGRVPGNVRRREAFDGPAQLARFFHGERLETIPARKRDRDAVLEHIVLRFETGRAYPEAEVNSLLLSATDDVAALRRHLIDARLLVRDRGVYRRP